MAKHDVAFSIPAKFVLSKDVEFDVRSDGAKLGTLLISKGNIEWVPASNTVKKYRLSWEPFADVMESAGRVRKMRWMRSNEAEPGVQADPARPLTCIR